MSDEQKKMWVKNDKETWYDLGFEPPKVWAREYDKDNGIWEGGLDDYASFHVRSRSKLNVLESIRFGLYVTLEKVEDWIQEEKEMMSFHEEDKE